jgi:hypothetical protein
MKRQVAAILALTSLSHVLPAQTKKSEADAPHPKVVLVELFTSEGCSDCPPADELLRKIDQKQTNSGQFIVGISEHVTYWNRLGWADPFSLAIYDERQSAYSSRFGLDSVYTPQMVVNGAEQFVGSNGAKLSEALNAEGQRTSSVAVHILSASVANGFINVTYSASGDFPSKGLLPQARPRSLPASLIATKAEGFGRGHRKSLCRQQANKRGAGRKDSCILRTRR